MGFTLLFGIFVLGISVVSIALRNKARREAEAQRIRQEEDAARASEADPTPVRYASRPTAATEQTTAASADATPSARATVPAYLARPSSKAAPKGNAAAQKYALRTEPIRSAVQPSHLADALLAEEEEGGGTIPALRFSGDEALRGLLYAEVFGKPKAFR